MGCRCRGLTEVTQILDAPQILEAPPVGTSHSLKGSGGLLSSRHVST